MGNSLLAKTPEAFRYDADGNLTNDGRWTYTWDAENRLVQQESLSSAPTASKYKLEFTYDSKSRRIQKLVSTNNGSTYGPQYTNRFAYDGWNLVAILNPQSSIFQSFTWGLDLSGSLQGAGGVGGLLMVNDQSTINNQPSTHFSAYDGNGNVSGLVAATSGAVSASYEYGPFSEVVRQTGSMAKANKFRFSTKYQDDESDYLYYGYRSYNPSAGRWLNRDPIEERGGLNLYGMLDNDPINFVDLYGLAETQPKPLPEKAVPCCTEAKIAAGEKQLNAAFQKAKDAAKAQGIKPVGPGAEGATCKNSSAAIIDWLGPYPPCWKCHLEERNYFSPQNDPKDDRRDHQVIICVAYLAGGKKHKEIIFDWWGDTYHTFSSNQSGGPPDKFRGEYRYPKTIIEQPFITNCDGINKVKPPKCGFSGCIPLKPVK